MQSAWIEVASSDQHTVKPWFNGKSIQSPVVVDTTAQGFPLLGGRIDAIKGTPVPVVVYSRRLHTISVSTLPSALNGSFRSSVKAIDGYNILSFTARGTDYVAASDLATDELQSFAKLLQDAQ